MKRSKKSILESMRCELGMRYDSLEFDTHGRRDPNQIVFVAISPDLDDWWVLPSEEHIIDSGLEEAGYDWIPSKFDKESVLNAAQELIDRHY